MDDLNNLTATGALDQAFSDRLLIATSEVAKLLGISSKTLREHVARGDLVYRKIGLGSSRPRMRFAREDIEEFLDRQKHRSSLPASPAPTINARYAGAAAMPTVLSFAGIREQRPSERKARLQKKRGD